MYKQSTSVELRYQLITLHRLLYGLGFIPFKFSSFEKKFVPSVSRYKFGLKILIITKYLSGLLVFVFLSSILVTYTTSSGKFLAFPRSFAGQEFVLDYLLMLVLLLCLFVFVDKYLKQIDGLLPKLNELLSIFQFIQAETDTTIYCVRGFEAVLFVKIYIATVSVVADVFASVAYTWNPFSPYAIVLSSSMFLSHMYYKLVLLSFYMKMNAYVGVLSRSASRSGFLRKVRKLYGIIFRLQIVTRSLDIFFTSFFVVIFLKLFSDISDMYRLLKTVVYGRIFEFQRSNAILNSLILSWELAKALSGSYGIFVIGRLSDLLMHFQNILKQNMMLLAIREHSLKTLEFERATDLLLVGDILFDLSSRDYELLRIDQQFATDFLINSVLMYVLTCLQFYASEAVYSSA